MSVRYVVDLDHLSEVIAVMARFQEHLDHQLAHLDAEVARLHLSWLGDAAVGHGDAHRRWAQGARLMHRALTEMSGAARVAHGSYQAAADTNASMWAGLA